MDKEIENGMFASDRCRFCGGYYEKKKPYLCPYCWELIKESVIQYLDELCPQIKELEASNKKLREAIDAIYDPNCDCYLCNKFRKVLEE